MYLEEVDSISAYDLRHVASNIREHDRREAALLYTHANLHFLVQSSVLASERLFVLKCVSGKVRGVGGISKGQVWMVGTDKLDTPGSRKDVLRHGREYLRKYLPEYGSLFNLCSTDPGQLRAMKALGFTVKPMNSNVVRIEICAS